MSEALLIKRARTGDLAAWAEIIGLHQKDIYRIAYLTTHDPTVAQDIAQETFLKAYRQLHEFDESRPIRPWLLALCCCLLEQEDQRWPKLRRGLKRFVRIIGGPSPELRQNRIPQLLWRALIELNLADRRLIHYRFFIGLSLAETSQALGLSPPRVRARQADALDGLFDRMEVLASRQRSEVEVKEPQSKVEQIHLVETWSAAMKYPPMPAIAPVVLDELGGRGPYHFQVHPVHWTLGALALLSSVLSLVLFTSVLPFSGETDLLLEQSSTNTRKPNSADQYSPASATRRFDGQPLTSLDLAGSTTLSAAKAQFPFPILIPAGLPEPDHVFLQGSPAAGVILLWLDDTGRQDVALFQLTPNARYSKLSASVVGRPMVNGEPALWLHGAYSVLLEEGDLEWSHLDEGHLLVWAQGDLGFRLETKGSLAYAVKLAESLQ